MPFNVTTGLYAPPAGATNATTGQVIQSAVWNTVHTDISNALTGLCQGTVPILAEMALQNAIGRNGSFDVWQRGAGGSASITITGAATVYTADGWYFVSNANQTVVASAQAALSVGSRVSAQFQRNSGSTGTGTFTLGFPLDTDEVQFMRGNLSALRFILSTGANWSPTVVVANVFVGTGAPTKQVNGYAGQSNPISTTVAIGPSASTTITLSGSRIASNAAQMEVQFQWTPSGTAGANDFLQIDDVQLEPNPVSSPYGIIPFGLELFLCQRHYQKTFNYSVAPAQTAGTVGALAALIVGAGTAGFAAWNFNPPLRAAPSVTTYSPVSANANWRNITGGADVAQTVDANTLSAGRIFITSATVAAASSLLAIHAQADAGI